MTHAAVTALLALSLSSAPFKGSPVKNQPPPPVEHPKPPPPPPQDKPEHDRPDHDQPHPERTERGPNYRQTGPVYQEDPAIAIIRRNMPQLEGCYGQAHSSQGVVTLEWDANLDGRVERAQVVENTTGNSELAGCILQTVKGWQFRNGDVTYPGHMRHSFQLRAAP